MNVTCQGCGTTYRVDPAKVPSGGVRARCATCDQVFWVRLEAAASAASAVPVSAPVSAPIPVQPAPAPAPIVAPEADAPVAAASAIESDDFSPLRTPALATAPDVTPVPASAQDGPVAGPNAPVAPAFSRPAFGGATLRSNAPLPSVAQELVPPEVADATRVVPASMPASPPPLPDVQVIAPASPPVTPSGAPPVRAGAATSALGGILPADGFDAPPVRAAALAAPPMVRPAGSRPLNPFLHQDPAARVRRLARALVSDMATYHPAKKAAGQRDGTLKQLFEEEIRKSWEEYADQVGRDVAESTPHFRDALNQILADGRLIF